MTSTTVVSQDSNRVQLRTLAPLRDRLRGAARKRPASQTSPHHATCPLRAPTPPLPSACFTMQRHGGRFVANLDSEAKKLPREPVVVWRRQRVSAASAGADSSSSSSSSYKMLKWVNTGHTVTFPESADEPRGEEAQAEVAAVEAEALAQAEAQAVQVQAEAEAAATHSHNSGHTSADTPMDLHDRIGQASGDASSGGAPFVDGTGAAMQVDEQVDLGAPPASTGVQPVSQSITQSSTPLPPSSTVHARSRGAARCEANCPLGLLPCNSSIRAHARKQYSLSRTGTRNLCSAPQPRKSRATRMRQS
ncbi:hypothetical protein IE81DRAFT_162267 [Ceraceosorus guamensis]|uniref:Uncharacterized protein n=1 Tax=Ceraceosorus guamensis TaxID=1522189 RepID=A0A316W951_9BASI|nr:hypothetical protein IE81DRAFT_162267 [Ceraceosorus guamensis]PWN45578.1 hypothetical protein IE81DRAFT_162267 [Ceraceosorus guamensis]